MKIINYRRQEEAANWSEMRARYLESGSTARRVANLAEYVAVLGLLFAVVAFSFAINLGE